MMWGAGVLFDAWEARGVCVTRGTRRWAGATPCRPVPGADIARAEGYLVYDAPGADARHFDDILGQDADEL